MILQFTNTPDNRAQWSIPFWFGQELVRVKDFGSRQTFEDFWNTVCKEVFLYDERAWHSKSSEGSKLQRIEFANTLFDRYHIGYDPPFYGLAIG
ncbi:MAG: hypothetical protein ACKKL4_01560 [Patescibacteria group bacterium]